MQISSSRSQYIELRKSTALQVALFVLLAVSGAYMFFRFVGIPLSHVLFTQSMKARVEVSDEPLAEYRQWRVVIEPLKNNKGEVVGEQEQQKVYYYDPMLALSPMLLAFGFIIAILITTVLPQRLGFVRQKIDREIINSLHKYARIEYGEHGEKEIEEIVGRLRVADLRGIHELEELWGVSFQDVDALQAALRWRENSFFFRCLRIFDALRLYLRNHFTIRYENLVMGSIYIGAAILIIVIGLRGLQFIPKDSPSLVLLAIFLEFILLIFYAFTLIFTKHTEEGDNESAPEIATIFNPNNLNPTSQQTEKLLRMFVAARRTEQPHNQPHDQHPEHDHHG